MQLLPNEKLVGEIIQDRRPVHPNKVRADIKMARTAPAYMAVKSIRTIENVRADSMLHTKVLDNEIWSSCKFTKDIIVFDENAQKIRTEGLKFDLFDMALTPFRDVIATDWTGQRDSRSESYSVLTTISHFSRKRTLKFLMC